MYSPSGGASRSSTAGGWGNWGSWHLPVPGLEAGVPGVAGAPSFMPMPVGAPTISTAAAPGNGIAGAMSRLGDLGVKPMAPPGFGGSFGFSGGGQGLGGALGWANAGISAAQTLFGIYSGIEQLGLAKKQAKLTKEAWLNNVQNAALAGNRDLEDRTLARQAVYAGSPNQMSASQVASYLDKNRFILPPSAQPRPTGRG